MTQVLLWWILDMLAASEDLILPEPEERLDSVLRTDTRSHNDLLLLATDRFCNAGKYDKLTINQYTQAFYMLAEHASEFAAQVVARSLAQCEATPRSIILYLAMQPISVATPVLKRATQLTQTDMANVLDQTGIEHARSLATRPDIGPVLVGRLKDLNDTIVDANLNNTLNPVSEPVAVHSAPKIHEKVERGSIAAQAREKLLAAAGRGGRLDTIERKSAASRPAQKITAEHFAEAFEKCARTSSRQAMSMLMRERFGLSEETAQQIFEDRTGDTLAVLMKANNIDSARANRVMLFTFPEIGLSVSNARRAMRFYSQLSQPSCVTAVAQWPKADLTKPAHQPYLSDTDSKPARPEATKPAVRGTVFPSVRRTGTE